MIEECLVVEFVVTDDDCPLADLSGSVGTTVRCQPPLRRSNGTSLLQFTVAAKGTEFAAAIDADDRIDYLHIVERNGSITARCRCTQLCTIHELVDAGFLVETLEYQEGQGFFSGGVVGYSVLRNVIESVEEQVGIELTRVYPLGSDDDNGVRDRWGLTAAQEEALRVAYERGYLAVPREVTASDVAAELDISKSAFLERLHRGEQQLFSQFFQ